MQAAREFDRFKSSMVLSNQVSADRRTVTPIYDRAKVKTFFDGLRLGDAYYDVYFPPVSPTADRMSVGAFPRPDAGETGAQLAAPNSAFAAYLHLLRGQGVMSTQTLQVVQFLVHPNSIDAYHSARELCAQMGVPAVWEFTSRTNVVEGITNFFVNRLQTPPRPVAPAAVAKAPAVNIPKPARTLD